MRDHAIIAAMKSAGIPVEKILETLEAISKEKDSQRRERQRNRSSKYRKNKSIENRVPVTLVTQQSVTPSPLVPPSNGFPAPLPITPPYNPPSSKKSQKGLFEDQPIILPSWIDLNAWNEWLGVRKSKKAPNTDYALSLAVRNLEKLKSSGHDPTEMINRAIESGWTKFFAPNELNNKSSTEKPKQTGATTV